MLLCNARSTTVRKYSIQIPGPCPGPGPDPGPDVDEVRGTAVYAGRTVLAYSDSVLVDCDATVTQRGAMHCASFVLL